MTETVAIIGCGWLGLPLAESLSQKRFRVHGSTTSKEKLSLLSGRGIHPFLISLTEERVQGAIEAFLEGVKILIINVPPRLRGKKKENYVLKMRLLRDAAVASKVGHILFVSSTSVYGDIEGEVTEATTPRPNTESGKQLLQAEGLFKDHPAFAATIVRFGGLIGPKRHPITFLSGRKGLSNGNQYVNLIHLTDCISVLENILLKKWWNAIFNAVYPYHPTKENYYRAIAQKRGVQPPEYEVNNNKKGKKIIAHELLFVKMLPLKTSIED